jgi:hypothetical protein
MEFLMVASQKLAGGDSVNVVVCWGGCVLRSKSEEELNLLPTMGSNLHPSHQRFTDSLNKGDLCKATLISFY